MSWSMAALASALLSGRDLQVLFPPDPSHALAVHLPAAPAQDRVLLLVAQARVAAGQLVQASPQVLLVGTEGSAVALGRAVLPDQGTCPSLGGPEAILEAADRPTSTLGAYQSPLATS